MFADDGLSARAAEGGLAVAAAMTTGAWPAARNGIIRQLLKENPAAEAELPISSRRLAPLLTRARHRRCAG